MGGFPLPEIAKAENEPHVNQEHSAFLEQTIDRFEPIAHRNFSPCQNLRL